MKRGLSKNIHSIVLLAYLRSVAAINHARKRPLLYSFIKSAVFRGLQSFSWYLIKRNIIDFTLINWFFFLGLDCTYLYIFVNFQFKYKKRVYKMTPPDAVKMKKLHSPVMLFVIMLISEGCES